MSILPEDPQGWSRLAERARWRLEHPDQSPPLEGVQDLALHLRLWSYPRWGALLSWGLFLPERREGRALVRELRWSADADRRRLSSALFTLKLRTAEEPSFRVRDAVVDAEKLQPFLVEAPRILSAWAARPPGVPDPDQDRCGIEGFGSLTHACFEWSRQSGGTRPPVVAWAGRLRRLLEASLRERETA